MYDPADNPQASAMSKQIISPLASLSFVGRSTLAVLAILIFTAVPVGKHFFGMTNLWPGVLVQAISFLGALLIFRRVGLVRLPFIVALLAAPLVVYWLTLFR